MLDKNTILFERGEDGQIIPQEITLELVEDKPKIKAIPLTRGKLQELFIKAKSENVNERIESDNEVILNGLIEPKLTLEEIKLLKPKFANAMSMAILSLSLDIPQDEINNKTQESIEGLESELKKK